MTDGPVRVWPRQALDVWKIPGGDYVVGNDHYTDAEFTVHFVPADRLDRLLAAVAAWCAAVNTPELTEALFTSNHELCAAWRAYGE